MSKSLGTLTLDVVAKIGGFTGPLDQSGRAAQKWRKQLEKDAKAAGVAVGAAGAAAAAGLGFMIKSSIDAADAASKAAQAVGLTTEAYTGLAFAADMSGIGTGELDAAMSRLNRTAMQAATGSEKQAALFAKLGVSAKDAGGALREGDQILMDLADRFQKMPDGIGKSSLAMEVFGKSGAKMLPLLNGGSEGIKELTGQARALGLVIGGEQARASEKFNDNLSILAGVSRGTGNVIAGKLLPVMNDFTTELVDVAIKGELAASVGDTLAASLKGLAATGVGVYASFQLVGKGIAGLAAIQDQASESGAWYEKFLPPVAAYRLYKNWQGVKETADIVATDLDATAQEFADILNRIFEAGKGGESATSTEERLRDLKKFLADFSGENEEAAKAAIKAAEAIESQVAALEFQAATVGMNAEALAIYNLEQAKATDADMIRARAALELVDAFGKQEAYKDLLADLRTEEERLTDQMRERLAVLDAMQGLEPDERMRIAGRIAADANTAAPSFGGLDASVGGAAGELLKIAEAEQALAEWREQELANQRGFLDEKLINEEQYAARVAEITEENNVKLSSLGDAYKVATLGMFSDVTGNAADMMKQMAGEGSAAYKALFLMSKAAAIAQTVVSTEVAAAKALELGPIMGIPAASLVRGLGYASVGMIAATSIAGMAHEGIDSIPQTGTWLLEKGERVTTAETSKKLDKTLDEISSGSSGGPTFNVSMTVEAQPGMSEAEAQRQGNAMWKAFEGKVMQIMTREKRPGGMLT